MKADILTAIRGLAANYGKELTPALIAIWCRALQDLTAQELDDAVQRYVLSDSPFFPTVGQIYALARPKPDTDGEASLITDKVYYALESFGTDRYGTDRAREHIGEVGWIYIQNVGGWEKFSTTVGRMDNDSIPTNRAQTRKSIAAILNRKTSGLPALPWSEPTEVPLGLFQMREMPRMENDG